MGNIKTTTVSKAERVAFLVDILSVQTKSNETERMNEFLRGEAANQGYTIFEEHGNIYLTKGEAPVFPCFIAHTDTVHRIIENFSVQRIDESIFGWNHDDSNMSGIGGDDKVGIFVALQSLRELEYGKAAFFRDEETGGQGAKLVNLPFFADCAFGIEADRQKGEDVVISAGGTDLASTEFIVAMGPYMAKYNRKLQMHGGFTDVVELAEKGVGISCINVSCGYYRPHSPTEVVFIPDVLNTLNFIKRMASMLGTVRWEYTAPVKVKPTYTQSSANYEWGGNAGYAYNKKPTEPAKEVETKATKRAHENWGKIVKAEEKAERKEMKSGKGIFPTWSKFRWEQGMSQVGEFALATNRRDINDGIDDLLRIDPSTPYPRAGEGVRTEADNLIEEIMCPECFDLALTINRDDGQGEYAYCWACRADWNRCADLISEYKKMMKEIGEEMALDVPADDKASQQLVLQHGSLI